IPRLGVKLRIDEDEASAADRLLPEEKLAEHGLTHTGLADDRRMALQVVVVDVDRKLLVGRVAESQARRVEHALGRNLVRRQNESLTALRVRQIQPPLGALPREPSAAEHGRNQT